MGESHRLNTERSNSSLLPLPSGNCSLGRIEATLIWCLHPSKVAQKDMSLTISKVIKRINRDILPLQ